MPDLERLKSVERITQSFTDGTFCGKVNTGKGLTLRCFLGDVDTMETFQRTASLRNKCGIYFLRNKITTQMYIGQSVNIGARAAAHLNELRQGVHTNQLMQNSWNKYGEPEFEFGLIGLYPKEELTSMENHHMAAHQTRSRDRGFNILKAEEIGPRVSPNRGKTMTQEQKDKISKALSGRKLPKEHVENARKGHTGISTSLKGRKQSEEHKKKCSEAKKGKPKPSGFGETISSKLKGKPKSPEAIAKRLETIRQREQDPEYVKARHEKYSKAHKGCIPWNKKEGKESEESLPSED
jgi:group I intron endonuclease